MASPNSSTRLVSASTAGYTLDYMLRYYAHLLPRVPSVLWQAANRMGTILFLVVMLIAVLNKEAAKAISDWEGFSPLWALLALGLFVAWGLLRANYEAVEAWRGRAEKQHDTAQALQAKEQLVELQQQKVDELQKKYTVSQAQYKVFRDFDREHGSGVGRR